MAFGGTPGLLSSGRLMLHRRRISLLVAAAAPPSVLHLPDSILNRLPGDLCRPMGQGMELGSRDSALVVTSAYWTLPGTSCLLKQGLSCANPPWCDRRCGGRTRTWRRTAARWWTPSSSCCATRRLRMRCAEPCTLHHAFNPIPAGRCFALGGHRWQAAAR